MVLNVGRDGLTAVTSFKKIKMVTRYEGSVLTPLDAIIAEKREQLKELGRLSVNRPSHPVAAAAWDEINSYSQRDGFVDAQSVRNGNGQKIVIKNAGTGNTFNFNNTERDSVFNQMTGVTPM